MVKVKCVNSATKKSSNMIRTEEEHIKSENVYPYMKFKGFKSEYF